MILVFYHMILVFYHMILVLYHMIHPLDCRTGAGIKTHPESKCPELLANYCDMLLRKTPLSKKLTSEEVEGKLKDVVRVLVNSHCRV